VLNKNDVPITHILFSSITFEIDTHNPSWYIPVEFAYPQEEHNSFDLSAPENSELLNKAFQYG